ncbi:MAG: ABC transporter ATP-binding protein [Paracoccus sp. (in: a-proteobacteria)]
MLELRELFAGYGATSVLHGLSLRVGQGSVHAMLGRNGAGKTAALRRIRGLLSPDRGQILLDGQQITDWDTPRIARAGLGYVPENREVFASLTTRENLRLAGRIGRGDWTIGRVTALFPNLGQRLDVPAAALSGGEQQMLAIGRALMTSPRLLLLDEPSEGLSVQMAGMLISALQALRVQGIAMLLVEQNIGLATTLADEITLVSRGRTVWSGDTAAFRDAGAVRQRYLGA